MASLIDVQPEVVRALESKLKDANTTLAEKYRVMFSLRNIRGETAHAALATGASLPLLFELSCHHAASCKHHACCV